MRYCGLGRVGTQNLQKSSLNKTKNMITKKWTISFSMLESQFPGLSPPSIFSCGSEMAK